jgi:hypothetical protein
MGYWMLGSWTASSFQKMSKKEYTFDNGKFRTHSAISRIDKFIISQDLDMKGG